MRRRSGSVGNHSARLAEKLWLSQYARAGVGKTALFARGIGDVTDIVEKKCSSFTDRLNGELTMRPMNEFTARRGACVD